MIKGEEKSWVGKIMLYRTTIGGGVQCVVCWMFTHKTLLGLL